MTSEQRQLLRRRIDEAKRRILEADQMVLYEIRRCVGCGGDTSGRTRGCRECADRHRKRRRRRENGGAEGLACRGCGVNFARETPGCKTCWRRHYYHAYRKRKRAGVERPPRPPGLCRGCLHSTDEYTSGCHVCASRWFARSKRNGAHKPKPVKRAA